MVRTLSKPDLEALARYAFRRRQDRSAAVTQAWQTYKLSKKSLAQTLDLSTPEKWMGPWPSRFRPEDVPVNASIYDYVILSLAKGDRVVFDDRTFWLGDFLGAGHSTHIFRLYDDPTRVVRLPFVAGHLTHEDMSIEDRIQQGYRLMEETMEVAQTEPPRSVFLPKASDVAFRYAVAQYVEGTLTGDTFVSNIARDFPEVIDDKQDCLSHTAIARLSPADRKKAFDLVAVGRDLMPFFSLHTELSLSKHLLWSERIPCQWKLIDTF